MIGPNAVENVSQIAWEEGPVSGASSSSNSRSKAAPSRRSAPSARPQLLELEVEGRLERRDHLMEALALPVVTPRGDAQAPAGPADAGELRGRGFLVGREHDADRRADDVEARVLVRQALGVALVEAQGEPALGGPLPRGLDQHRREIDPGHVGAGLGGQEGGAAGPAADVEPPLPEAGAQALDGRPVHRAEIGLDALERPRAPHEALLFLQLLERHYRRVPSVSR